MASPPGTGLAGRHSFQAHARFALQNCQSAERPQKPGWGKAGGTVRCAETQYQGARKRVEELMLTLPEDTPKDDPAMVELELLGNLVADYDEEHYPIGQPSLIEVIKLRMYEMGLSQVGLAKLLGVSPSRICDYLSGKSEPTMKVGRLISKKLNIAPPQLCWECEICGVRSGFCQREEGDASAIQSIELSGLNLIFQIIEKIYGSLII